MLRIVILSVLSVIAIPCYTFVRKNNHLGRKVNAENVSLDLIVTEEFRHESGI